MSEEAVDAATPTPSSFRRRGREACDCRASRNRDSLALLGLDAMAFLPESSAFAPSVVMYRAAQTAASLNLAVHELGELAALLRTNWSSIG